MPANLAVNAGQVVERLPDAFVFRPFAPLANGQGLLEGLFRLAVSALFPVQGSQRIKNFADLGVAVAELSFSVIDRLFEIRNRLGKFSRLLKRLSLHHCILEVARFRVLTKMFQEQGGKDRQKNKSLHTETPPGHDILRWTGNFALF